MQRLAIYTFLSVILSACATRAKEQENYIPQETTAPKLTKKPNTLKSKGKKPNSRIRLLMRLADPSIELTRGEEDYLSGLSSEPSGPIGEAVLVLSLFRKTGGEVQKMQAISSGTLYENKSDNEVGGNEEKLGLPSLEALFLEKGIDLAETLERNYFLKNYKVYKLASDLLNATSNSEDFNAEITTVVQKEARNWVSLMGADGSNLVGTIDGETPAETQAIVPAQESGPKFSEGDLKLADMVLMEAQKLAEKGEYAKAIVKASKIGNQDPMFQEARKKVKSFSNHAVQILRQQAAQAFQSAMPVVDPEAKIAYLEEAKKYLEEAIKNFPDSDQLDTVHENLAVISRDIDRLSKTEPE